MMQEVAGQQGGLGEMGRIWSRQKSHYESTVFSRALSLSTSTTSLSSSLSVKDWDHEQESKDSGDEDETEDKVEDEEEAEDEVGDEDKDKGEDEMDYEVGDENEETIPKNIVRLRCPPVLSVMEVLCCIVMYTVVLHSTTPFWGTSKNGSECMCRSVMAYSSQKWS